MSDDRPTLLCMHGLPRSGKSTLARDFSERYGAPVVSGDAIRLALHGQRYAAIAEPMVRAIKRIMVQALFHAGHKIVISDDTHYSREARDYMKSDQWMTRFAEVNTSADICKARAVDTNQLDLLPVIDMMVKRHDPLGDDEERW
jgi:predicted kinase